MRHINLYQAAFRPPKVALPAARLLPAAALFLAALLGLYAWDAWRLERLREEVAGLSAQADKLERRLQARVVAADPATVAEADALEQRVRQIGLAQAALASGRFGSETGYSAQFRALGRAKVANAWLTRVSLEEQGRALTLSGRALAGEDAARLIARLGREPLFAGLAFSGLEITPPAAEKGESEGKPPRFLEFTLSARPAEAPPAASAAKPSDLQAVAAQYGVSVKP